MKIEILNCSACNIYTLEPNCPECNSLTLSPKPAKFSPLDKWGKYRRITKIQKDL